MFIFLFFDLTKSRTLFLFYPHKNVFVFLFFNPMYLDLFNHINWLMTLM